MSRTTSTHDSGLNCMTWTSKAPVVILWCIDNTLGWSFHLLFLRLSRNVVDHCSHGKKDVYVKKIYHMCMIQKLPYLVPWSTPATNGFPQQTLKLEGHQDACLQLAHAEWSTLDIFLSWITWSSVPWNHFLLLSQVCVLLGCPNLFPATAIKTISWL